MCRAKHVQQLRGAESFGRQRAVELSHELVTGQLAVLKVVNHTRKASHLCEAPPLPLGRVACDPSLSG